MVRLRSPTPLWRPDLLDVTPERFEQIVADALDGLPPELGRLLRNVAILVEDDAPEPGLLGRYEGVPLTSRDSSYAGVLPDRISIYRRPLCRVCRDEAHLVHQVRVTVAHEVAHHFGIDDDRLDELGWG